MGIGEFGIATGALADIGNFGLNIWTAAENNRRYKEQMRREDTAVQRRMADLRAAGINPVLAAGQAAESSAAIRAEAPQLKSDNIQAASQLAATKAEIRARDADIRSKDADVRYRDQQILESNQNIKTSQAEENRKIAETQLIQDQTAGVQQTNATNKIRNPYHESLLMQQDAIARELRPHNLQEHILRNRQLNQQIEIDRVTAQLDTQLRTLDIRYTDARNALREIELRLLEKYGIEEQEARLLALQLANKAAQHDIAYAQTHGRPVGSSMSGNIGSIADMITAPLLRKYVERNNP